MKEAANNHFMPYAWREKCAAMTATNDQDIEKAFADQASGFIENACGDLMKPQHRVGFEIVKKNDDNTRMVGISCFRVGDEPIYAPVFFLNGEIKGPLLYRSSTRTFVPANKEWASYLIESMEKTEGKGRNRTQRAYMTPLVRMRDIAFLPPGMGKRAAAETAEDSTVLPTSGKNTNSSKSEVEPTGTKNKVSSETDALYSLMPGGTKIINVPAKWKKIDVPCACMNGVQDLNLKSEGQKPELTNGETVVKMANFADGTIRMDLGNRWEALSVEDADAIKSAAWQGSATLRIENPDIDLVFEKEAAAQILDFINAPSNRALETIMECREKVAEFAYGKGLIAQVLREPDFGKAAGEAIVKAADGSFAFAERLASIYGSPKNLLPERYTFTEKPASAEPKALVAYYDADELMKSAAFKHDDLQEFFKSGAVLKDTRDRDALEVVWDINPSAIQAPDDAGEYSILMEDGTFLHNAIVMHAFKGRIGKVSGDKCQHRYELWEDFVEATPRYYVISDGKVCVTNELFGVKTKPIGQASKVQDKPSQGKTYYVYMGGSDTAVGPIQFEKIDTADGVLHCQCSFDSWQYGNELYTYRRLPLSAIAVNPDVEKSDIVHGVFGADAKFVPVTLKKREQDKGYFDSEYIIEPEHLLGVGGGDSLDNWIFSVHGASKVEIERLADEEKQASFRIGDGKRKSAPMRRAAALIKLAADLNIHADQAYELVDRAEKEGKVNFYVQFSKKATHLMLADRPNLDDTYDTEFGIPLEPVKKFVLRVQGDQMQETPSAIGDAYDPATPTGLPDLTVATTEPEDLQQLADVYHLPNVFEHGVVGTLANTFNATYLVDKYTSKIEDAVDVLGRTKFLLYWCPGDFEKAYGTDDMQNFEAEVDSNFENLGACLLKLLKRSDKQRSNKKQESEKSQ